MMPMQRTRAVLILCFTVLLANFQTAFSQNREGIIGRINSRGFDFMKDELARVIEQTVSSFPIPGLNGSISYFVSYEIRSLSINSFTLGQTTLQPQAPEFLVIGFQNVSLNLNGSFSVFSFLPTVSGDVVIDAPQVTVFQRVAFRRNNQGTPTVSAAGCNASFENLAVQFHNVSPSIAGSFLQSGADGILSNFGPNANYFICSTLQSVIEGIDSAFLQGLQSSITFPFDVSMDASLSRDPAVTDNSLDIAINGRCFPRENMSLTSNFVAPIHPPLATSSSMLQLSVSDFVINTFLASVEYNGGLDATVNQSTINALANGAFKFNAEFLTLLNPNVFTPPGVDANAPVSLVFHTQSTPYTLIQTGSLSIIGSYRVYGRYYYANGSTTDLKLFQMTFNLTNAVSASGNMISWNIIGFDISFSGSSSPFLQIFQLQRSSFITSALPMLIGSDSNQFTLPPLGGYALDITGLTLKENVVELITDISATTPLDLASLFQQPQ